jgi:hypothetical protein
MLNYREAFQPIPGISVFNLGGNELTAGVGADSAGPLTPLGLTYDRGSSPLDAYLQVSPSEIEFTSAGLYCVNGYAVFIRDDTGPEIDVELIVGLTSAVVGMTAITLFKARTPVVSVKTNGHQCVPFSFQFRAAIGDKLQWLAVNYTGNLETVVVDAAQSEVIICGQ